MPAIKAVQVSQNYFVGVTTLADIQSNCLDPKEVDRSTERQRKERPGLDRAYRQRGENQRQFNKPRIDRAKKYGEYIAHIQNGGLGGYPPITLWTEEDLPFDDGKLTVIGATVLTANDGETQLAARYMLASVNPEWLDVPFPVTITTNSTKEAAQQTLHDMNYYATPVSEKDTAPLNVTAPLTKAINEGIARSGLDVGLIKARSEKVTRGYFTTMPILIHGAIGALYGTQALSSSPNALLKRANVQFGDLGDDANIVTGFIADVLRLPSENLQGIGSDQMLAMGVKFNSVRRVLAPLSDDQYQAIDNELKLARNNKRATVTARAAAIAERLAA